MIEQHIPTILHALGRTLMAIRESIAAMALTLERIEEIAAEARAEHKKHGFKYSSSLDPEYPEELD